MSLRDWRCFGVIGSPGRNAAVGSLTTSVVVGEKIILEKGAPMQEEKQWREREIFYSICSVQGYSNFHLRTPMLISPVNEHEHVLTPILFFIKKRYRPCSATSFDVWWRIQKKKKNWRITDKMSFSWFTHIFHVMECFQQLGSMFNSNMQSNCVFLWHNFLLFSEINHEVHFLLPQPLSGLHSFSFFEKCQRQTQQIPQ